MRLVGLVVALAVLLVGCGQSGAPSGRPEPAPVPVTYPADQVVLQIDVHGGLVRMDRSIDWVPEITLWGDGRLVFVTKDESIREGHLTQGQVGKLVGQAEAVLRPLESSYMNAQWTDAPDTSFSVSTGAGTKTVSVYAFEAQSDVVDHQAMDGLRSLWDAVDRVLPPDALPYQPVAVEVHFWYGDPEAAATTEWPAALVGRVTGEQAKEALRLQPLGPGRLVRHEGRVELVVLAPVLPVLHF
jgi:hypothetical protein